MSSSARIKSLVSSAELDVAPMPQAQLLFTTILSGDDDSQPILLHTDVKQVLRLTSLIATLERQVAGTSTKV